ncbi:MAG: flagellar biosynthetic protein FliO [Candidatus Korobacteraceae bacterium]
MKETVASPCLTLPPCRPTLWARVLGAFAAVRVGRKPRRLRLCESLSLGEKRFVAVIQYEGQQFLVGGGASSLSLLARLGEAPDFATVMTEWCERQR